MTCLAASLGVRRDCGSTAGHKKVEDVAAAVLELFRGCTLYFKFSAQFSIAQFASRTVKMQSKLFFTLYFVSSVLLPALAFPTPTDLSASNLHKASQIFQAPGPFWYENLLVRSTNSKLLVTSLTAGNIFEFPTTASPTNTPQAVATFPDGLNASTGIVEIEPDVFAFAASTNYTVPGTWEVWKLDLRPGSLGANGTGQLTRVASVPEAGLLNGVALLRSPDIVLMSDTFRSSIWRIDINTGAYNVAINDTILAAATPTGLGANGIKVFPKPALHPSDGKHGCGSGNNDDDSSIDRTLYFINTDAKLLGSFPIDPVSGAALGAAKKIATASPDNGGKSNYDDFVLDSRGNAFLANGAGDTINFVDVATGEQKVVAGHLNSTEIAQPTSVALDMTERVAFVTTAGGLGFPVGPQPVGGQILRIEL